MPSNECCWDFCDIIVIVVVVATVAVVVTATFVVVANSVFVFIAVQFFIASYLQNSDVFKPPNTTEQTTAIDHNLSQYK